MPTTRVKICGLTNLPDAEASAGLGAWALGMIFYAGSPRQCSLEQARAHTVDTSAATLPLALARSEQDGRLKDGDRVLLGAFGAGFTWGATVIDWGIA